MNRQALKTVVLASNNTGKLKELRELLSNANIELIPQSQLNIDDAEETGLSFIENALIKARHAAKISGLPALADDSGIAVNALNGQPGIYSARFSGTNATDASNNAKLLKLMENIPARNRAAEFHCVLAFLRHAEDPTPIVCHGIWAGEILTTPSGINGFGYDPLFFVKEENHTSAELPASRKQKISHRAKAMEKLREQLDIL